MSREFRYGMCRDLLWAMFISDIMTLFRMDKFLFIFFVFYKYKFDSKSKMNVKV